MALTFGVLATIVKMNALPKTTSREIVSGFVTSIDSNAKYGPKDDADQTVSKLINCEQDFPTANAVNARTQIMRYATDIKAVSQIAGSINENVVKLIAPGKEKHILFALKDIVKNDSELLTTYSLIFENKVGMSVDKFIHYQSFELPNILAGLFLFTVIIRNNTRGKETVDLIRRSSYWEHLSIGFLVINKDKNVPVLTLSDVWGLDEYKRNCFSKYGRVPTVLPSRDVCQFEDIFVCTDIEFDYTRHSNGDKEQNVTIFDIRNRTRHLLIAAQGGNGKSMRFTRFLFDGLNDIDRLGAIPFLVSLRFYSSKYPSLIVYVYREAQKVWPDFDFYVFMSLINSGKVILLLDGLDEMSTIAYKKFKEDLVVFLQKYCDIQIIMSARPYMGWIDEINGFNQARLCGLNYDQAVELINRVDLYPDNKEQAEKFMRIFDKNLWRKKRELTQNPLLLCAMMYVFYEDDDVPLDGFEFFRRTFEIFATKHDKKKPGFKRIYATGLILSDLKPCLYEFAYKTYMDKAWALDMNRCNEIYSGLEIREKIPDSVTCEDFMTDMEKNLSVMQQDAGIYSFFQHAFQEYFGACYMASKSDAWLRGKTSYFENNRDRTIHDYLFTLLYDKHTTRVNESIILPRLWKIFRKRPEAKKYVEQLANCSKKEADFLAGYWSYVLSQYPDFKYHKEDGKDCHFVLEPKSAILEFILHYKKYPSEKILEDGIEKELEPKSYFHDPLDGNDFDGDKHHSDEIKYEIHGEKVLYNAQRRKYNALYVTWGEKERTEVSWDISFSVAELLNAPTYNSELIEYFERDDFPLMKEYVSMRDFFAELKVARSKSLHSGEEAS